MCIHKAIQHDTKNGGSPLRIAVILIISHIKADKCTSRQTDTLQFSNHFRNVIQNDLLIFGFYDMESTLYQATSRRMQRFLRLILRLAIRHKNNL